MYRKKTKDKTYEVLVNAVDHVLHNLKRRKTKKMKKKNHL